MMDAIDVSLGNETLPAAAVGTDDVFQEEAADFMHRLWDVDDPFTEALTWTERSGFLHAVGPLEFPEDMTLDFCEAAFAERVAVAQERYDYHPLDSDAARYWVISLREYTAMSLILTVVREVLLARAEEFAATLQAAAHPVPQPQQVTEQSGLSVAPSAGPIAS